MRIPVIDSVLPRLACLAAIALATLTGCGADDDSTATPPGDEPHEPRSADETTPPDPAAELARLGAAVTTDDDGRIVRLAFGHGNPTAEQRRALLDRLPELRDLKSLDLTRAGVADDDLQHVAELPDLRELRLAHCGITDKGLSHLGGLDRLVMLDLDGTRVTGTGLEQLADLDALRTLRLVDTGFTGTGLEHLPQIESLHLGDAFVEENANRVPPSALAVLADHEHLVHVDLSHTDVTDEAVAHLSQIPTLVSAFAVGTPVTGTGFADFPPEGSLRSIDLGACPVSAAGCAAIGRLSRLTDLDVSRSGLVDEGVAALAGLTDLEALSLAHTRTTDDGAEAIATLPSLRLLDVGGTRIGAEGLTALAKLPQLEALSIADTSVTQPAVDRFRERRPDVQLDRRGPFPEHQVAARPLRTVVAGGRQVRFGTFVADGSRFVAAGEDKRVSVWNVADGNRLHAVETGAHPFDFVTAFAAAEDGRRAALAVERDVYLVDFETESAEKLPVAHERGLAFSPDGKTLAIGTIGDGDAPQAAVVLWDVAERTVGRALARLDVPATSLAFAPDGETIAIGTLRKGVQLRRVADGERLRTLDWLDRIASRIAFVDSGRRLAISSVDGALAVASVDEDGPFHQFPVEGEGSTRFVVSPNATLTAGLVDGRVRLYDADTGEELSLFGSHQAQARPLAFSPDGTRLATTAADGRGRHLVLFWDAAGIVAE